MRGQWQRCYGSAFMRYLFIINFIQTNTFQCVLASADSLSFVIFLYADDGIEWTTGDASGGENWLGGTPAQAGFDAGNQMDFLLIEGSFTNDIINIDKKSNVGQPGLFVFQVNTAEVQNAEEGIFMKHSS